MSADVIPFPSRARPRTAQVHAREGAAPCAGGEIYRFWRKRKDRDEWLVEWQSEDGSSACILATFDTAAQADRFIADWRQGPDGGPRGAA